MRGIVLASLLAGCGAAHAPADLAGPGDAAAPVDAASPDLAPPAAPLGANVEPGGVVFRVWAPDATAAEVEGTFAGSPAAMTLTPGGVFEAHVAGAAAGDTYHFVFDDTRARTDPYCRQLSDSTDCTIVDPSTFTWSPFSRPARNALVAYELHVGSYAVPTGASNGTFASLQAALPSIAQLGVNAIELMPIQSFGAGPEGWGYNPQLWMAPKSSYGTSNDLRSLVDGAHQLGVAVWMDSCINHADSYAEAPLACFDATCPTDGTEGLYFFPAGMYATTPYGPRPNYPSPQVAAMFVASANEWLGELHGDGFRWDSVSNIRAIDGSGTVPGGMALLVALNATIHANGAFSVAEDLKGDAAITQPSASGGFGFDAQWDGFGYTVDGVLAQANDADRDMSAIASAVTGPAGADPFTRLLFTEDHDTVGNGGSRLPDQIDPADPTSYTARKLSLAGAVLLLTSPGVPMIFEGQEALATGTFVDPPPPLPAPTAQGLQIRAAWQTLLRLRRNLDGVSGGLTDAGVEVSHENDTGKVIGYLRSGSSGQDVLVVVNLMNKAYTEYDVGVDTAGPWTVRFNSESTTYSSDFGAGQTGSITARSGLKDGKAYTLPLQLAAYSAMILTR